MNNIRVLLLTSYCNINGCSENFPCLDCLQMCNVAVVPKESVKVIGDFGLMYDDYKQDLEVNEDEI